MLFFKKASASQRRCSKGGSHFIFIERSSRQLEYMEQWLKRKNLISVLFSSPVQYILTIGGTGLLALFPAHWTAWLMGLGCDFAHFLFVTSQSPGLFILCKTSVLPS